jgi:hypothetical protein
VWQVVREQSGRFAGDFDGSGLVDQSDLDLVLLSWGQDALAVPAVWQFHLPTGRIDQDELDQVLLNWGGPTRPLATNAVPEPPTWQLLALLPILGYSLAWKNRR